MKALGATDQHSQIQLYREGPNDKIITMLEVKRFEKTMRIPDALASVEPLAYLRGSSMNKLMAAELRGTMDALKISNRPVCRITLPRVNANTVAQLLYLLEVETAMAGRLYNITLKDITVEDCQIPGMIMGIPGFPVENVTIENVSIVSSVAGTESDRDIIPDERNLEYPDAVYFGTMPAYGVYARHVTGPLKFFGEVTFASTPDEKRAAVILDDVAEYDLAGIAGDPEIIVVGQE